MNPRRVALQLLAALAIFAASSATGAGAAWILIRVFSKE